MQDDASATTALAAAPGPRFGSDPHAFAGLYVRHRASFTSHARRYLRDPRDADEVVQEAFLRLFLTMPELESELQALAYCRRTITNLCIDRYRADARRPRLVALESAPVDELADVDTDDPVVRDEDAALVREALSRLPELHRAALIMREIEEKPLQVIADELDVAEDSVKHLLFRARRGLRKLLVGTSVAPGVDAELTRGLRPAARGTSGGAAALLLLALLGLGSGPDLRAVPVVGVDLPDVLGVTAVADAVGQAVRDVVGVIVPGGERGTDPVAADRPDPSAAPRVPQHSAGPAGETGTAVRPEAAAPSSTGTTTVVTVVDGRPVVTTVPARPAAAADGPVTGSGAAAAGAGQTRTSRPTPVTVDVPTGGREVRAATPVRPAPRDVEAPTRAGGVTAPVRPPSGEQPGRDAAERAEVQQRVEREAAKAAEKAQQDAAKAADRAADEAERAADKAAGAAEKAADRAADEAERAADNAADEAAKAADKAEKAADKAARGQAGASQAAVDEAARRGAARAAEVAAARAAAATVPTASGATTLVPAPAP